MASLKEQWLAPGVVKEIAKWLVIGVAIALLALGAINREWIGGIVTDVAGWAAQLKDAVE